MGIRPSIEDLRGLGDFATLFRWAVTVTVPPGVPTDMEDFNLRCESVDQPKLTNAAVEVTIRGHKVKQPGISTYGNTLAMTVVETVDSSVMNSIKAWREKIWETKTGKSVNDVSNQLKGKVLLQRLDAEDQVIWSTELIGVYIEDYEAGGQLGNSSNEAVKPSITFSYDYFQDSDDGT